MKMDWSDIARKTRREHERLKDLIVKVETCLHRAENLADDDIVEELKDHFFHFRAHLYKQVSLEENGGYMEAALDVMPTLDPRIRGLRRDHRDLMEDADDLHARLQGVTLIRELRGHPLNMEIRRLLADLRRHEHHENALLAYAFSQDLGAAD